MRQQEVLRSCVETWERVGMPGEPLLHEKHTWEPAFIQGTRILGPIGQRHRRIETDKVHACGRKVLQHCRIRSSNALESSEEPMHVQRLAVGPVRRKPGPKANRSDEIQKIEQEACLVVACEGVLHDHNAAGALSLVKAAQNVWRCN